MTGPTGHERSQPADDPEERDPGLARERTSLAWMRTALSFAAVGGVALKANVITVSIVAVSLLCLAVTIFGEAVPGALR